MGASVTQFWDIVRLSVIDAPAAGRSLMTWRIGRDAAWSLLALGICLSVILIFALSGASALALIPGVAPLGPLSFALMVMSISVLLVFGLYFSGDALGGQGRFADTILVVAWFQIMQLLAQVAQTFALIVAPILAFMLGLAVMVWLIWLLLSLIKEINGFDGYGRAALTALLAVTGVVLGLSLMLGLLGVGIAPE